MQLASLSTAQRKAFVSRLTPNEVRALLYEWRFWARPSQVAPPGDWRIWLTLAGRGWGKTRTGGEWIRERVDAGARHLILAGATTSDVRDIIVEGESGIMAISPPWNKPEYEPSKARVTWPSGARALLLSADEPDRFRGKQCDTFWADELAAWRYPDAWDQLQLGFRLGSAYGVEPRGIVSTTPRPTPIIRQLVKDASTHVTVGSTYENRANLAPAFLEKIIQRYEGTRLGRQELYAEILDDAQGALWQRDRIDGLRVKSPPCAFTRIVVAVDPSVSSGGEGDECGIVVAARGEDGHGYILSDASGPMSPDAWARKAIQCAEAFSADRIVAEENNGGQLVEINLRTVDPHAAYKGVRASKGKRTRAEPISALYEQGKVHHLGMFPRLEDQMCTWEPTSSTKSPDRIDALVWALTELLIVPKAAPLADALAFRKMAPRTRF